MMPPSLFCVSCGVAIPQQAAFCSSCGQSLQAAKPILYDPQTGLLLANVSLKQRYRIIAYIGQGGMGTVYKAVDTQLGNRMVALKEMRQDGLNPQEQKMAADAFKQEAIMLARLHHHSNLPSIIDHFEENKRWYLVMSFIEGETLEYYLRRRGGKLLPDEAINIGMELCNVLDYLHSQQSPIIFRDLKPTNIMRKTDGHINLIDFGIARHFKPEKTKDTISLGSIGYAAPEQYGNAQTNPQSDIYNQLISGIRPSTSPLPPLQSLVPNVSTSLISLINQMLETDKDKRPVRKCRTPITMGRIPSQR